jgi:hypothetical protein
MDVIEIDGATHGKAIESEMSSPIIQAAKRYHGHIPGR